MSKPSKDYEIPNQYARREMRQYLSGLSEVAFGARGKWKKLCTQLGLDIFQIKEQMETIVNYMKENVVNETTKPAKRNRKQRRYLMRKRHKVRQRKAKNDSPTTGGAPGSGQSYDNGGK